jgi:hypothetical protein
MEAKVPMPGPSSFQWNRGGWFGSQLGGTAWMIVGAVMFARRAPWIAAVWLVCFVLANAIGTGLWRRRGCLRPYPAIQLLLLVGGVIGLLALASFGVLRPAGVRLEDAGWNGDVRKSCFCLVTAVSALMAWFALMEGGATKAKESGKT